MSSRFKTHFGSVLLAIGVVCILFGCAVEAAGWVLWGFCWLPAGGLYLWSALMGAKI